MFDHLSPDMRKDVRMVDPRFDPAMMDLRAEQRRQKGQNEDAFDAGQVDISKAIADLMAKLPVPDLSAYDAATKGINTLGDAADRAALRLDKLLADLPPGFGTHPFGGFSGGATPVNPQSGGTGAGVGLLGPGPTANLSKMMGPL
jgi:hypothetical protein